VRPVRLSDVFARQGLARISAIAAAGGAKMKVFFRWGTILLLGLQLAGCITDYGPVDTDALPIPPNSVASRLQTGDELKVIVFGEDQLSGIYEISPAGTVVMPLIGAVPAAGRTRAEIERQITQAYARGKFLQEPKITVSVTTFRPIYVFGEVGQPGKYAYTSGVDVLTAIATAGGFTYRASKSSVLIRHAGDDVWQEYSLAAPVLIEPGDLIRVPERYF
jgi:protein involved in polysaccharide export with SLBB domain